MIPDQNKTYKLKEYWNSRFSEEKSYDWLASYQQLSPLISEFIKKSDQILIVGCGNSTLGPQMDLDGYKNITSCDFSDILINKMQQTHPHMKWLVSDVKDLKEFESESFDVIFDKATMDALVTDEGSQWDPNVQTKNDCESMCKSVYRCLKKGGIFVQLTFQDPYFRKKYIENPEIEWKIVKYQRVDCGLGYHLFNVQKY